MPPRFHLRHAASCLVPALWLCLLKLSIALGAQQAPALVTLDFDLPADFADKSLKRFSEQAGLEVLFPSQIAKAVRTRALKATMAPREALDYLLSGTGLIVIQDEKTGAFSVRGETKAEKNGASRTTSENLGGPATSGSGSLEGRIQNVTTGDYLNNARIMVEGTNLSALTNEFGEYRISGIPAGAARITVFYSGLPPQTITVNIPAGQRAVRDIELKASRANDAIQLEAFTVSASRTMTDAAIATNEQRFAPNMKTVLAADTFGEQSENNVAEFLKLMPTISIEYVDQDARSASIRGMPSHTTIVTSNGNQLASATSEGTRAFQFEQISINDIARIEVNKSLLPDMAAEGIGGTINLITKSAFERSRPEFRYRTYVNVNTTRTDLGKTPGPGRKPTYKIKPCFDFTYINPITKTFGFTLSLASSTKYNPQNYADRTWTLNPDSVTKVENPYLTQLLVIDAPKTTDRYSGRISLDWRFAPHDVLSIGFSDAYYFAEIAARRLNVNSGTNPASYSSTFVQSRPGAGSASLTTSFNEKDGTTWTPEFKYAHNGPVWTLEAGGAYSHSSYNVHAADKGHFANAPLAMSSFNPTGSGLVGPTVRFDYTGNYVPLLTVTNATGQTVNAQDADNGILSQGVLNTLKGTDTKKTLRFNARRALDLGLPITVKAGGDLRQSIRDSRAVNPAYQFLGPDRVANTPDNAASLYALVDDSYSTVAPPFGLPNFRWADMYKLWGLYVEHPDWWSRNLAAEHTELVTNSRNVVETIASGFVRLDGSFFHNRLNFAGGIRFQNYRVHSESGEANTLGQYVHDEDGNLVFNPATGQAVRSTGSALEINEKTNIERGVVAEATVRGFYPSVNAAYKLTENIQVRAAFANSINYPQLSEVASRTDISDLSANPRRLTANKPLGPWTAHNYDLDLEYYTQDGGFFTFSVFRKDVSNFINQARYFSGTPEANAALSRLGYAELIPLNFEVLEKYNGGDASIKGWEFALNQKLDHYAPAWARGITIFANTSYKAAPTGARAADLDAQSMRAMNWGAAFHRGPFSANLKWNHIPEPKRTVPINNHPRSRTYLDLDMSYRFSRAMSFFASGTNVTGQASENYIYTSETPDYARRRQYRFYGVQCVAGIKGQF